MGSRGIFSFMSRKSAPDAASTNIGKMEVFLTGGIGLSMQSLAKDCYIGNPYARRAADLKAGIASSIKPLVFDKRGNEIEDQNHPALKLIKNPNPKQSWDRLMDETAHNFEIFGNAFWWPIRTIKGISEVWSINPMNVSYIQSTDPFNPVKNWIVTMGGKTSHLMPDELIHFKEYNPISTDILGTSQYVSCRLAIELQNAVREWNISTTNNGANPSLIIKTPKAMSEGQFKEFMTRLQSGFAGKRNTGKGMVLDDGKDIAKSGFNAVEMDFMNAMIQSGREIAMACKVPPELMGDSTSKTYSNAEEANVELARHTMVPIMKTLYGPIDRLFSSAFDIGYVTFDIEEIIDLFRNGGAILTALTSCNFLSTNEKREKLGYEGIGSEGDVILMPFGLAPINQIIETPDEPIIPMDDDEDVNSSS